MQAKIQSLLCIVTETHLSFFKIDLTTWAFVVIYILIYIFKTLMVVQCQYTTSMLKIHTLNSKGKLVKTKQNKKETGRNTKSYQTLNYPALKLALLRRRT